MFAAEFAGLKEECVSLKNRIIAIEKEMRTWVNCALLLTVISNMTKWATYFSSRKENCRLSSEYRRLQESYRDLERLKEALENKENVFESVDSTMPGVRESGVLLSFIISLEHRDIYRSPVFRFPILRMKFFCYAKWQMIRTMRSLLSDKSSVMRDTILTTNNCDGRLKQLVPNVFYRDNSLIKSVHKYSLSFISDSFCVLYSTSHFVLRFPSGVFPLLRCDYWNCRSYCQFWTESGVWWFLADINIDI